MEGIVAVHKDAVVKALMRFDEAIKGLHRKLGTEDYVAYRNSVIKTLEFSIDMVQKYLKVYMQEVLFMNIEEGTSPRKVFKLALKGQIIQEDDLKFFLNIVEDRNRTAHTYSEFTAEEISKRALIHYEHMKRLIDRL